MDGREGLGHNSNWKARGGRQLAPGLLPLARAPQDYETRGLATVWDQSVSTAYPPAM